MSDLNQIRSLAPDYFSTIFNQNSCWSIFPKLIAKRKLTIEAVNWLKGQVSDEEIKKVIFQCNPLKAPGLDGYNAAFFSIKLGYLDVEVTNAISTFFKTGKLIKELNHTFLILALKSTNASQLSDYRPISCCNVFYKFISKVLANWLQQVIEELNSPNQNAFLN